MESGEPLMARKTVLLELEWVMRGYYGFEPAEIAGVFRHLLAMPQVIVEDRSEVEQALAAFEQDFDFADALHHASYRECAKMASFDAKKFARRANRLGFKPPISLPRP
jgi:predicted nucleic-acid-binding protein